MNRFEIGPITIESPDVWKDITEAAGDDCAPFTLAKDDGVGALQFSSAKYQRGKLPEITLSALDDLRTSFAKRKGFSSASDELRSAKNFMVSGGSYQFGSDFVRVWYCSNGLDIVLATYICTLGNLGSEPEECESIILGLQFHRLPNTDV